jgi:peptide-methionine (R)-S-oxide reductase
VYLVTRQKATEPAFSSRLATSHPRGTFLCACCDAELFKSQHKFDSGTGWPSFWQPASIKAIEQAPDNTEAEPRIEVMCRRCGAHLGHVFNDGPPPTGLRYCINALSLKLKPPDGDAAKTAPARSKSKTKPKAKNVPQTTRSKKTPKAPDPDSPDQGDTKPSGSQPPRTAN